MGVLPEKFLNMSISYYLISVEINNTNTFIKINFMIFHFLINNYEHIFDLNTKN